VLYSFLIDISVFQSKFTHGQTLGAIMIFSFNVTSIFAKFKEEQELEGKKI